MTKSDAYILFTISLNHFNQTTRQLEELDTIAYHTIIIKQSYSHLNYDYDKHFNKCKNIYDRCVKKQTDIEMIIEDIAIQIVQIQQTGLNIIRKVISDNNYDKSPRYTEGYIENFKSLSNLSACLKT